ncbi:uncharacterized protein AKAME5_001542800 [Lates japonicus]|uniref:Uncharacterized protein n=1 Tax=Lates japonicus TaxID=270547 RepID=A0AAD3RCB5_LATJO|nr:uncharacterized protein AKAME5_001542800 [Lates japonicus]
METLQTSLVCGKFWIYVAVIAIFILLGSNFECTCKPQAFNCNLYLVLPVFITSVFLLWTDRTFQRVCRHLCSSGGRDWPHTCSFLGSALRHIVKAAFIGLLWMVCVFIDGDWYVCCMNDQSEQQAQLACKSAGSITDEDRANITELKNRSWVIGSFLLFCIVCVPALWSSCGWRKHSRCERKRLFYKLILKEEKNVLREMLRKHAKEKLTKGMENRISHERWEECFDVAEELIQASTEPTVSEPE